MKMQGVDIHSVKSVLESGLIKYPSQSYLIKLLLDCYLTSYNMSLCKTKIDLTHVMMSFAMMRSNHEDIDRIKMFITECCAEQSFIMQSDDSISSLRNILDNYKELRESPVFDKVYKLFMYALSLSLFDRAGITMDKLYFTKLHQEAIRKEYHMGPDLIYSLLDTITFLCERGSQCFKTGSIDPIFHNASEYAKWHAKCRELLQNSQYTHDMESQNLDIFQYLSDLNDCIENGAAIKKHLDRINDSEAKLVGHLLSKLEFVRSDYLTKRAAMRDRKAPLSLLVHGTSSIGKSTFIKALFYHYGKVSNLNTSPEFKYTRNSIDPYWVNFNSSQWCVLLDDIAFMKPGNTPDPTVMEMLQVINNVPYVPIQADLGDKGKTPMRARLVLASTNIEHLNAESYFACPLAVQRRFPYIITLKVKEEFSKDGIMLDGHKTTNIAGEYPDYWIIEVKKIEPIVSGLCDKARMVPFKMFTDINHFMDWYTEYIMDYNSIQVNASQTDEVMEKITLCEMCKRTQSRCSCIIQSSWVSMVMKARHDFIMKTKLIASPSGLDIIKSANEEDFITRMKIYVALFIIWLYMNSCVIKCIINRCDSNFIINILTKSFNYDTCWRLYIRLLGDKMQRMCGYYPVLVSITAFLSGSSWLYRFYKKNLHVKEQAIDCWYNDSYQLTSHDIGLKTTSWKNSDYVSLIENNCISIGCEFKTFTRYVRAFGIKNNIFVTVCHGIPTDDEFYMEIIRGPVQKGPSMNCRVLFSQRDVYRIPNSELCVLRIRHVPPISNLMGLLPKRTFNGKFDGRYVSRNRSGDLENIPVRAISEFKNYKYKDLSFSMNVWFGYPSQATTDGFCGSVLIADTSFGPSVIGLHMFGAPGGLMFKPRSAALQINVEDVELAIKALGDSVLSANNPDIGDKILGDLHPKSSLRYVEDGVADVYGTFKGWRAKPKSKVCFTALHDVIKHIPAFKCKHRSPDMTTWKPWFRSVNAMTHVNKPLSVKTLDLIVDQMSKEIIEGLEDKIKEVFVLDDFESINGIVGRKYIDGINRSSSMGFPYNCTKKKYIVQLSAQRGLQDPIDFTDEIKEEVDRIKSHYRKGERASPIYSLSLKDEPVTEAKYAIGKTRGFCAAPAPFTLVERQYYLTFTALVQNNPQLFESAVGVTPQSKQWEEWYNYLVKFGPDRIIGGDYQGFDTTAYSIVLQSAFQIIINVLQEAGYSAEDLIICRGIMTDVCFPYINANGDLMQTHGVNPSGHALTVIINGLVNSIFMRYAYYNLNPESEIKSFRSNVQLVTYGDDNGMGVNPAISFFNHTTISDMLSSVGIVYTMAEKDRDSVPFINISEFSFLKRRFVYDHDVGAILCPLEEESLIKTLNVCVASKTISLGAQTICGVASVVREYFFYGKAIFESRRKFLMDKCKEADLELYIEPNTFPTWDELKLMYFQDVDFTMQCLQLYRYYEYVEIFSRLGLLHSLLRICASIRGLYRRFRRTIIGMFFEYITVLFASISACFIMIFTLLCLVLGLEYSMQSEDEDLLVIDEPDEEIESGRRGLTLCNCNQVGDSCCLFNDNDAYYACSGVIDVRFWRRFSEQVDMCSETLVMFDMYRVGNEYTEYLQRNAWKLIGRTLVMKCLDRYGVNRILELVKQSVEYSHYEETFHEDLDIRLRLLLRMYDADFQRNLQYI